MTTPDDDDAEMADQLEYPGDIALLMRELRELGRVPPPQPSPDLEALMSRGIPKFGRRRVPRRVAAVAAFVLGATSATGVAAAADRLPGPVAEVVNDLTPLHVGDHHHRPAAPTPTPTRQSRTSAPDRSTHPRPPGGSGGPELEGPPPANQPAAPPDDAPSGNTREDDGPAVSPSRWPSPSPSSSPSPGWSDDDRRSSPSSLTRSATQSRTGRDH
jgi:hypothetical protein